MFVNTWFTNALNTWYLSLKKKNWKAWLGLIESLQSIVYRDMRRDNTWGRDITGKVEWVYFLKALWLSWNQTCSNTSTYTLSREEDSIGLLQNQFSNISVTLWKHQHYNQQQEG